MDFFNFLTLIALGLSSYGIASLYEGKVSENGNLEGKGIISLAIGTLSICWLNPVFPHSMFPSLVIAVGVTAVVLGYMANTFSKAKKSDNPIIHVEVMPDDEPEDTAKKEDTIDGYAEEQQDTKALENPDTLSEKLRTPAYTSLRDIARMRRKDDDR